MIQQKEIERLFRQEFRELMPNMIWQNDDSVYEVFGYYRIMPQNGEFRVFCSATDIGIFSTTRSALSWCIADKNKAYNLARELKELDNKLLALSNDIAVRSAIADRSKRWEFRDPIGTKLETKIIRKKQVENQLAKCINWAKQSQISRFETKKSNKK